MANRNINLGTFDFKTDNLDSKLVELRRQMTILKNEISTMRKEASDSEKEFVKISQALMAMEEAGEEASEEYQELAAQAEELNESLNAQVGLLEVTESQLRITQQEYREVSNIVNALTDSQNELNSVQMRANQLLEAENTSIAAARQSNKDILALRNQLNPAIKEEADLIELLNNRLDENNEFIKNNASAYERQKINIGNYSESIQDALSKIDPFNFSLSQFITISSEAGGSGAALSGIFGQLRDGIIGMTRAAISFIATPIGAAITALAGVGLVAREFWNYNKAIQETIVLTERLTGITGDAGDSIRQQAQAISDTFGTDFEETLITAQKLVQNFGISYDNALSLIQDGLAQGGVANKEFFDSLKEYPVFFQQAGFSAQEFVDVVNAGFDLGIYNDKLPDAIKEAGISLQEQTKATRDALVNAFGATFTDDVLKRVRTGQTSVKDALNEIAEASKEANLNQQQLATLTADVFRGAGEDAGGALKVFEALNAAQEKNNKTLTETEKYYQDLAKANAELAKARDEAFKSDGLISFQQQLELLWTKVQTVFYNTVAWLRDAYEWYNRTIETSKSLNAIWATVSDLSQKIQGFIQKMGVSFKQLGDAIGISSGESNDFLRVVANLIDPVKKLEAGVKLLSNLFDFFATNVESAITNLTAFGKTAKQVYQDVSKLNFSNLTNIGKTFKENRKAIEEERETILARNEAMEAFNSLNDLLIGKLQQTANASKVTADSQVADTKKLDKAKQDAFDAEIKRMQEAIDLFRSQQGFRKKDLEEQLEIERRIAQDSIAILNKELANKKISREKYQAEVNKINMELAQMEAELVIQNAADELEEWKRLNETKLENGKVWNEESVALELERLNEQQRLQMEYELERFNRGLQTEREYQAQLLQITTETETKKKEIEDAFDAQKKAERLALRESEFQAELLRMQEEGATRWEIEQAQRDEQYQLEIEKLAEQREQNLISEELYQAQLANIEKKWNQENAQAKIQIEEQVQSAKMQIASQAFNMLADAAGKETELGKAAAVAQATINTYQAATAAYSAMAGIPVVGPALGAAAAALAVATGLMNVKKIVSTKTPKAPTIQGFATGGIVTDGVPIQRSNGDDVLITAKRGEVILNQRQQSIIGTQMLRMAGVPGFATGGVVGSNTALIQNDITQRSQQIDLSETISEAVRQGAMEGSRQGSAEGSQTGLADLSTNMDISRKATF